jgi:hypothetical protein
VTSNVRHRSDEEIIARAVELTARPAAEIEADYWRLDAEWDSSADHGHLLNTLIQVSNASSIDETDHKNYLEEKYS